jgi:hypothetical protein
MKIVHYLPFYHITKFGKFWSNIMVVFTIYKFRSVWKIEKNVRFNDLEPARWNSGPGWLQTDCAARESNPGQGSSAAPRSHQTSKPSIGYRRCAGPGALPLSLSSDYKEENTGRSFHFPVAISPMSRWILQSTRRWPATVWLCHSVIPRA